MSNQTTVLIPLLLASLAACVEPELGPEPEPQAVVLPLDDCEVLDQLEYSLEDMRVEDDHLVVDLLYPGCVPSLLRACWNGVVNVSLPPQMTIQIDGRVSVDDACDPTLETVEIELDRLHDFGESGVVVRMGGDTLHYESF